MIGLIATFQSEKSWAAAREEFNSDKRLKDALSPFAPTEPQDHDLDLIHVAAGIGALLGLASGFAMQVWSSVFSAPLDVGGRPLFSWPSYIPVCFVLTLLGAGLAMTLTLFLRLKLPWYNHPVFASREYDFSADRFYLNFEVPNVIEANWISERLRSFGADQVAEIPCD